MKPVYAMAVAALCTLGLESVLALKRIRVAVFSTYPPSDCGIAQLTKNMMTAIKQTAKDRVYIEILSVEKNEAPTPPPPSPGITVRHYRLLPATEKETILGIASYINQKKFNVLFVHHDFGLLHRPASYNTLLKRISPAIRILTVIHTGAPYPTLEKRELVQNLAERSHALIALGWKVKYALHHFYGIPEFKIIYLPYGTQLANVKALKTRTERVTLLMSGVMRERKGVHEALQALKILKDRSQLDNIHLLIVGKDCNQGAFMKDVLAKAEELGVRSCITWNYGFADDETFAVCHKKADIYLAPFIDGVPTTGTLSFAMAAGLPVIASAFGMSGELLGLNAAVPEFSAGSLKDNQKSGFVRYTPYGAIIPIGDAQSLANAIHRLATDKKLRRKKGAAAKKRAAKLTWNNVSKGLVSYLFTKKLPKSLMVDRFRKNMFRTRSRWNGRRVVNLNGKRIAQVPNGAYSLYLDSFVSINALVQDMKVEELSVRLIEYTEDTKDVSGLFSEEAFIYAKGGGKMPDILGFSELTASVGQHIQVVASERQKSIFKRKQSVVVSTPNLVFRVVPGPENAVSLIIYGISRFAGASGLLGVSTMQRFSALHQNGEHLPTSTWKLPGWDKHIFSVRHTLQQPSWLKGNFYGLSSKTKRRHRDPRGAVLAFSPRLETLFLSSRKGNQVRKILLANWNNNRILFDLPAPSAHPSLKKVSLEVYIIAHLILESKQKTVRAPKPESKNTNPNPNQPESKNTNPNPNQPESPG
ncbi:hypothetical protein NEDG_01502 [Nematocida displodere]|uniref:Glycosyl transferase family 1 domain-containing protein n=1 Tax=Nematocida displodere TaxID=1805483 RepID=A0A177EDD0_9MICR|nr:hypothetical protein NEDG_01502 [Nematocida displodere]